MNDEDGYAQLAADPEYMAESMMRRGRRPLKGFTRVEVQIAKTFLMELGKLNGAVDYWRRCTDERRR